MRQIVLRAFNTKKQQPVKVCPLQDRTGKLFTGQGPTGYYESLTPDERKNMSYVAGPETYITLYDGKVLDIEKDHVDKINWVWMQKHPYISMDKDDRKSRDAVFYVENKEKEARIRVTRDRKITKVKYLIENETTLDQRIELATALGLPGAEGLDSIMLEDWLVQKAETVPDTLLEMLNPESSEDNALKALYHKLVRHKVLEKHRGGIFRFGGDEGLVIGRNEEQVVAFLKNEENKETVVALQAMLLEKTGEKVVE